MFYTGTVFTLLSIVFGSFLVLLAHWIAAAGLFVQTTDACRREFAGRPVRCTLVGLVTFGSMVLFAIFALKRGGGGFVLLAGSVPLLISFIGTAGIALHIGTRLCGSGAERWRVVMRGSVILGLCFITPFLGWLIIAPLGLASGFGALLLAKPWKSAPKNMADTAGIPAPALP